MNEVRTGQKIKRLSGGSKKCPFCPSCAFINKNKEERTAKATEYAEKSGVYVNEEKAAWWWLRSLGSHSHGADGVDSDGWVYWDGYHVLYSDDGVRPALYLNLQS